MKGWPPGYTPSRERERVAVDLGQGPEAYLLRWKQVPEPACFTEQARSLARCKDFDGGAETGTIELVRLKGDREVDAFDLSEAIGDRGRVVLPRFAALPRFSARGLAAAAPATLLVLADVNQDGRAAEVVLPGPWRAPTGTRLAALVGFGPVSQAGFAFIADRREQWERVRTMTSAFEVVTWRCLAYASPEEHVHLFDKTDKGVTRARLLFGCRDGGGRGEPIGDPEIVPLGL